jgi:hypothetical protein
MNIHPIIITSSKIVALTGIACVALVAAPACSDDDADVAAGGTLDSGAQGGNGGNGGGSGNDLDGGAGTSSTSDAGADAAVCELDTAAAMDGCEGESIDIAGEYSDGFGTVSIGSCSIFGSPVTELSNDENYMVTQNSCEDPFNPGKWSRHDWTWFAVDGGELGLYYCTAVFDADTEADAIAAPRADDTDPTTGGCGTPPTTFPWSLLTPIAGGSDAGGDGGDAGGDPADAAVDAGDGG